MPEEAHVHTIELTDDELKLVRQALHSFLDDFSYHQKDVIRAIEALLAKLPTTEGEVDQAAGSGGSSRVPTEAESS